MITFEEDVLSNLSAASSTSISGASDKLTEYLKKNNTEIPATGTSGTNSTEIGGPILGSLLAEFRKRDEYISNSTTSPKPSPLPSESQVSWNSTENESNVLSASAEEVDKKSQSESKKEDELKKKNNKKRPKKKEGPVTMFLQWLQDDIFKP